MRKAEAQSSINCHICHQGPLKEYEEISNLHKVTSDCRPWYKVGHVGMCLNCGTVQKLIDREWQAEFDKVNASYALYFQSGGVEQPIFDSKAGTSEPRSVKIINELLRVKKLPATGNLLDVGCGNGAFIKSFVSKRPDWTVTANELEPAYENVVKTIKQVTNFNSASVDKLEGQFDLIVLFHVLEHIKNPTEFLQHLRDLLTPSGSLLIQVPDLATNPFDLTIIDHSSHFSSLTLRNLLEGAGFELGFEPQNWISKELTVSALKAKPAINKMAPQEIDDEQILLSQSIGWLTTALNTTKQISEKDNFGIFGTGYAAVLFDLETNGMAEFFVDEVKDRTENEFLGRAVYLPEDVPKDANIIVSMPTKTAEKIAERLGSSVANYFSP